jgi:putative transposase
MRLTIEWFQNIKRYIFDEILLMIDYLRMENQALRSIIKENGMSSRQLDDAMRFELSTRGRKLHPLSRLAVIKIASPKTVCQKWFQKMKAKMYGPKDKSKDDKPKRGAPSISERIREEVIKIAQENVAATLRGISNALKNAGFSVSHETIRKMLKQAGIDPSPDRINGQPWHEFMKTSGLWQMDFTCVHLSVKNEVTGKYEFIRYHILFFIEVATRKVVFGGIKENPDAQWLMNRVKGMLSWELAKARYLLMDNDPVFSKAFDALLKSAGINPVHITPYSPNLNAYIERFHRSIKEECLSWLFLTSEAQLRIVVCEYLRYYNTQRPHQSLGGLPPEPDERIIKARNGELKGKLCKETYFNGLLNFYYREAAKHSL